LEIGPPVIDKAVEAKNIDVDEAIKKSSPTLTRLEEAGEGYDPEPIASTDDFTAYVELATSLRRIRQNNRTHFGHRTMVKIVCYTSSGTKELVVDQMAWVLFTNYEKHERLLILRGWLLSYKVLRTVTDNRGRLRMRHLPKICTRVSPENDNTKNIQCSKSIREIGRIFYFDGELIDAGSFLRARGSDISIGRITRNSQGLLNI